MEGENGVGAGEPGYEVALQCVNGFFDRVGTVVIGGGKLGRNVFLGKEFLECPGAFIIAFLEQGGKTAAFEVGEDGSRL